MLLNIPHSYTQVETSEVRAYVEHPEPALTYNVTLTGEGIIVDVVDADGFCIATASSLYVDFVKA